MGGGRGLRRAHWQLPQGVVDGVQGCRLSGAGAARLSRTTVRNLVRASVPVAKQLTGHKTRAVFERYDIVDESDSRAATAKLNVLMGTLSRTPRERRTHARRELPQRRA